MADLPSGTVTFLFTDIGANFEEAATLALLPGAEGDAGRETLRSLRCPLPVSI